MNAKDTVINKGRMVEGGHVELLLEQQAERSFKAGQKEVMEWFENNRGASYQGGFLVNGQLWQSQLKEWEIEK